MRAALCTPRKADDGNGAISRLFASYTLRCHRVPDFLTAACWTVDIYMCAHDDSAAWTCVYNFHLYIHIYAAEILVFLILALIMKACWYTWCLEFVSNGLFIHACSDMLQRMLMRFQNSIMEFERIRSTVWALVYVYQYWFYDQRTG
jgi:hypothetical protein